MYEILKMICESKKIGLFFHDENDPSGLVFGTVLAVDEDWFVFREDF